MNECRDAYKCLSLRFSTLKRHHVLHLCTVIKSYRKRLCNMSVSNSFTYFRGVQRHQGESTGLALTQSSSERFHFTIKVLGGALKYLLCHRATNVQWRPSLLGFEPAGNLSSGGILLSGKKDHLIRTPFSLTLLLWVHTLAVLYIKATSHEEAR